MGYASPSSQTAAARPISFLLDDLAGVGPAVQPVEFYVRPESLSRQDASRLTVVQTLGGAWADSFGAGLPMINIAGHTGWKRGGGPTQNTSGEDGLERFTRLKNTVFDQWHARRQIAVASGLNPDLVRLVFSDGLDGFACTVAPQTFVLQRSRSRPLLAQYQISMVVLNDGVSPVSTLVSIASDVTRKLGLESLANTIDRVNYHADHAGDFIDSTISQPVSVFLRNAAKVYQQVSDAVQSVEGVGTSLVSVARNLSWAGVSICRTIGMIATLPQRSKAFWGQVASAFTNAYCLLRNAIKHIPVYDDYSAVYGSSNCSSTSGGRALSAFAAPGLNTLASILPAAAAPVVSVSSAAQASIATLAAVDVVNSPIDARTSMLSAVKAINSGLAVA